MDDKNMKNKNRKGFTLIEVLAVVVIIGVIASIAFAVYFNTIDKSKSKSVNLALNNIKSAAELYVKESFNGVVWNKSDDEGSDEYSCVTISELINAGYFKERFYEDKLYENLKLTDKSFVSVVRNSENKTLEVTILNDDSDVVEKCKINVVNDNNDSNIQLLSSSTYTDTVFYKFKQVDGKKYVYLIKKKDTTDWSGNSNIKTNNNEFSTNGLIKSNDANDKYDYDFKVCLYSDAEVASSNCANETDSKKMNKYEVKLNNFKNPDISVSPDSSMLAAYRDISINYSDDNIYGNNGAHFFMSEVNGKFDSNMEEENDDSDVSIIDDEDIDTTTLESDGDEQDEFDNEDGDDEENPGIDIENDDVIVEEASSVPAEKDRGIFLCEGSSINDIKPENCKTKASFIEAGKYYYTTYSNVEFVIKQKVSDKKLVHAYIKDGSGNYADSEKEIGIIDTDTPQCSIGFTETSKKGKNGYYTSKVTLKLNTGDKDGITAVKYGMVSSTTAVNSYPEPTNMKNELTYSTNGTATIYGYVEYIYNSDKSKVYSKSYCKKTIKLDTSKPTCTVSMKKSKKADLSSLSNYDGSWYHGYVRTSPVCTDTGGSGCSGSYKVKVTPSKSKATAGTFANRTSRNVSSEGKTIHTWIVSDKAGNTGTCKATIKIDNTSPKCDASKSNTSTTSGVTAKFTCKDRPTSVTNSGVASCTSGKTGLEKSKSYEIKDNAGNAGTCKVSVTKVKQYSYRTRSKSCKSCSKAGCKKNNYKTCKTSACGYKEKTVCKLGSASISAPSGYTCGRAYHAGGDEPSKKVWCRNCKKMNSCQDRACGCKKYNADCKKCGTSYGSWGSWSSWSTKSCSESSTKQCKSRTVYK